MNERLKSIVDLNKYPIHNLNSPIIKELIEKCKKELEEDSCSTIPNFILPQSLEIMNSGILILEVWDISQIKYKILEEIH